MAGDKKDWKKAGWEAAGLLSELIRIDTTNPPGNETQACRFLEPRMKALGLETEIVESAPGRGSIVGRLRAKDPKAAPLLLLSHLDVVPAEAEGWTHPPFSGAIEDGFVWGRGALDCKNATAAEMTALRMFTASGRPCSRDVIIAATADEEAGGKFGVEWLVSNRPELLDAGFCVNEGGGFGVSLGESEVYFCQTAEKGVCWFKLTSTGEPGHASVPSGNSAMDRMLEALAALRKQTPALSVSRIVRQLVDGFISAMGGDPADGLSDEQIAAMLMSTAGSGELKNIFNALTRNTLAVTMVHGGTKANVIPAKVEATIDCRIVPGHEPSALLEQIRKTVAPFKVNVEPIVTSRATEIEPAGELYDAMESALKAARPNASMVPFMVPGGTDGRFLAERGVAVYGFIPVLAEPGGGLSMLRRAHGIDERVGAQDLSFAVEVIHHVLERFCS